MSIARLTLGRTTAAVGVLSHDVGDTRLMGVASMPLALAPDDGHLTRENVHHGKTRREFTFEVKDEAVKLVIDPAGRGQPTPASSASTEATLGRRVNLLKASQDASEPGITETETAELLRLRKENAGLKLDRAFLKQASLFFAQEA